MAQTMLAKNAISAPLAECYITIPTKDNPAGNRYNFMSAINLEAAFDKNKAEIPILGRTSKGHKATSWSGTGSATFHYNTSIFRELFYQFQLTGEDVYFDIIVTNDDPAAKDVGRQTIILKDCNFDGGILTKFDADGEYLDESMDFTFESFEMPEKFNEMAGMV